MAVAISRGAPPPSISSSHRSEFGYDQSVWPSNQRSTRSSRTHYPQQQQQQRRREPPALSSHYSAGSLPSPPQQPEPTFSSSTSGYDKYGNSPPPHDTPLSPPASDGLMSPPTHGQELSEKAVGSADIPGLWMQNSYAGMKPENGSIRLPEQSAHSPPPMFIEDILRDLPQPMHPPTSSSYLDEKGFEIQNMQAMQSAPLKRGYSEFLLPSPYAEHQQNAAVQDHHQDRRFHFDGSGPQQQRPRKKRRLTNVNEANFRCDQCGKLFSRIWNYNAHLDTHNPDRPRPHVCPEHNCGKSFVRRTDLTRHTSCVHAKDKKYKCKLCANTFARKDTLRRHEDDGCPKRVDIVSRNAKHKPRTVQSEVLNYFLSQRESENQRIYYNPYDDQAQHYETLPPGLPRISEIVPIQKAGW